jgi:hypothetical protein
LDGRIEGPPPGQIGGSKAQIALIEFKVTLSRSLQVFPTSSLQREIVLETAGKKCGHAAAMQ